MKVLIADDESIIRKTIRIVGKWEEYQMEVAGEAANGIEVIEFLDKNKVDVLLLDMKMPGYNGVEILSLLFERNMDISVVVISGYDDFKYAKTALKYGVLDYILKPIDRNELNHALERISKLYSEKDKMKGIVPPKDILEKIKYRIDEEYASDLSLNNFANEYFMNKDVLSRSFKKRYEIGLTNYINKVRMEQAKVYLLLGYNSTKAAELTGYKDVNYFGRVFKKFYDTTPKKFAEDMKTEYKEL